jgi:site-specific DNA-methyltransferase (adenine-specific)
MDRTIRLFFGDNLGVARRLEGEGVRADLVYLDPPFGVGQAHGARTKKGEARAHRTSVGYDDGWRGIDAFLASLRARLVALHALLSPRGTMYLHLDHRAVHEAKVACDGVMGRGAFRGEIVWSPGNGGRARSSWGATHQTILVYTADARETPKKPAWIFHADDPAMREPYAATSTARHFKRRDGGARVRERTIVLASGPKTYRYDLSKGRRLGTVWTDLPSMRANTPLSKETTGYPHQKPEALLQRIVRASSDEASIVFDPFCGSGTTLLVAAREGRRAIGCDASELAIETTRNRLEKAGFRVRVERA